MQPIDPNIPSTYIARSVTFQPRGGTQTYEAVIVEHETGRDGVRHLFKIHITTTPSLPYPPRVVAALEELTPNA